jgi:hypothetical protein
VIFGTSERANEGRQLSELVRPEFGAVVGRNLFEPPAGGVELAGDQVDELGGPAGAGVAVRCLQERDS